MQPGAWEQGVFPCWEGGLGCPRDEAVGPECGALWRSTGRRRPLVFRRDQVHSGWYGHRQNSCLNRGFSPFLHTLSSQKAKYDPVGLTSHDLGYENGGFLHMLLKSRILLPPNQNQIRGFPSCSNKTPLSLSISHFLKMCLLPKAE